MNLQQTIDETAERVTWCAENSEMHYALMAVFAALKAVELSSSKANYEHWLSQCTENIDNSFRVWQNSEHKCRRKNEN